MHPSGEDLRGRQHGGTLTKSTRIVYLALTICERCAGGPCIRLGQESEMTGGA